MDEQRDIYRIALQAVANETRLPCLCGEQPYTNGLLCPLCNAIFVLKKTVPPQISNQTDPYEITDHQRKMWEDVGMSPTFCDKCAMIYQIVRPGKIQPNCECHRNQ